MNSFELLTSLETLAAVGLLAILFLRLIPAYRLSAFRQRVFSIRDEMFDYAAAGNVSFDEPAYVLLRKSMNSVIRYGHRLSFFQMLITIISWSLTRNEPTLDFHEKWGRSLSNVKDSKVREDLMRFHVRLEVAMIRHLTGGSVILMTMLLCATIVRAIRSGWTSYRQLIGDVGRTFLPGWMDIRLIEEDARRSTSTAVA